MNRRGLVVRRVVAVVAGAIVASACTGAEVRRETGSPTTTEQPRQGGTISIVAGDPLCMDWYSQCGGGNFGITITQTLPSPMVFVAGQYRATAVLAGDPMLDIGPPQRVTYRIDPRAVWSDGTPITSSDFRYTWEQGRASNVRGMGDIAAVDDADPKTAVVTWREISAPWRERFRPLLPRHLLDGKDRNAEMKDGYRFSGGPFMIDHWTRGQEIKLVRNPRYWGPPAHLDAIVFRVIPDPSAARQAYKSGQVDLIIQAGAEPGIEEMKGLPDTGFEDEWSLNYSFIAFNTKSPPLDRLAVRQALGYATDRDAIVTQLQGHLRPGVRPLQSLVSFANPAWYSEPFARYRRDLTRVAELMRTDGWSKGADGVWARPDGRARIELLIDGGLRFQTLFSQIVQSQWKEAGFEVEIKSAIGSAIVGELLPRGNFQASFTGSGTVTSDPGQCARFCSRNVPTEATRFVGGNITRTSTPALDDIWARVDTELDEAKRRDLVRRGQELLAEEVPVLPLATIIEVYVYSSRKIGGSIALGPYATINEWYCRTTCA